jgi:predicted metal-dependent HD superfamily phosphohydrolase
MSPPRTSRPLRWLHRQWAATAGTTDAIAAVGDDLLVRYGESQRRYHTVEHLAEVLQTVRSLAAPDDPGASFRLDTDADYRAVSLAAWYHDAVYDPTSTTNEEESAALVRRQLGGLGFDGGVVDEVTRLVLVTKTHSVERNDLSAMVLTDADLAILAARVPRYDRYAADVRLEYGHVDDKAYRAGRSRVLQHFLDRGSIYSCDQMVMRCDGPARANLQRELDHLGDVA